MLIPNKNTPFYLYDISVLNKTLESLKKANKFGYKLHYAMKANYDDKLLNVIKNYGHGADCVSGGELKKALEVGFKAKDITLAGVGKTDDEIKLAIDNKIGSLNIESLEELEVVRKIASEKNKEINVCLRINPNIDAHTHDKITTGLEDNKFGISLSEIEKSLQIIKENSNLVFVGIHFHIGSQINDMNIYKILCKKSVDIVSIIESKGHKVETINLGGGLAINYENPKENIVPDFESYFETIKNNLKIREDQELHFEFGRAVVAQCGFRVTKVLYSKNTADKKILVVDAGMTELIRPALYNAYHFIENINCKDEKEKYTIVGPICESTDVFAEDREIGNSKRGDILVIYSAGAYGQTMSSEYNLREKVKTYYIE